jgi:hypothetical protein
LAKRTFPARHDWITNDEKWRIRQIAQTLFVVLEVLRAQDAKLLSLQIEQDSTEVIQKLIVILYIRITKDEQLLIL